MEIILDPGHGGTFDIGKSSASGVCGPGGMKEKHVTLRLARLVSNHLGSRVSGVRVGLTRTADHNPSLAARAAMAKRNDACVFVSLHANAGAPGARGSETWVHDRSNGASQVLANALRDSLAQSGHADRGVKRGNLAVLTPERLGSRTAACLVEVDFLTDPDTARRFGSPETLDQMARAIAHGVQAYLGNAGPNGPTHTYGRGEARALDEPYFTDTDQLSAYMNDQRAADTRVVSTKDAAHGIINTFRSRGGASPWQTLDRAEVADRLSELVDDPRRIQQGALNLCGPAAFLCMWNGRDPVGFATYATQLFDAGASTIGTMAVSPGTELLAQDYAAMHARMGSDVCPQADWMAMGAIRNTSDVFWQWGGDPAQQLAGLTRPEELTSWLQATGIYGSVRNEANWATLAGIPHATHLNLFEGTDISLLIHINLLKAATGRPRDETFILNQFPNHFIVLTSEVVQNVQTNRIEFGAWTWGTTSRYSVDMQSFLDNYYGAVIASLPSR